jgi:hypothetical protein
MAGRERGVRPVFADDLFRIDPNKIQTRRWLMKRALRVKSVGTKVSEAELRVLESRAAAAGLTLSEWVRDVLLGSSVEMGTMAAERAILAEVMAMRTILLNFMLKLGTGQPIPEKVSRELIAWADGNKMRRALEVLAKSSTREERMQTAPPEPKLPKAAAKAAPGEEL